MRAPAALVAALAVGCGLNARAPTAPARATPVASGVHVTLPHWFQADFPGAVEESQVEVQTDAGTLPFRRFVGQSATVFAEVRVVESPSGFSVPKETLLASMINASRTGKALTAGTELHEGAFVGADARLVAPPHSPDNPSAFAIVCRMREFLSDTKWIVGLFCGDAAHPDPALDRAADSLHVLE